MKPLRFIALSFIGAIGFLLTPTILKRIISVSMCGVLGATSPACYVLGNSRAVAAHTPTRVAQTDIFDNPDAGNNNSGDIDIFRNDGGNNNPGGSDVDIFRNDGGNNQNQPETNPNNRLTPGGSTVGDEPCNPVLLTTSAQPGKEVVVTGIPESFSDIEAVFQVKGTEDLFPVILRRLENQDVAVLTPLNPISIKEGGDIEITIATQDNICPAVSLNIEPLIIPAGSSGSALAVVNKLESSLEQVIENLDIDTSALRGNPSDLEQEILPLGLVQWLIDHPDNPDSLKALIRKAETTINEQNIDLEIIDALVSNSGLVQNIDSLFDAINNILATPENQRIALNSRKHLLVDFLDKTKIDHNQIQYHVLGSSLFNFVDCHPRFVSTNYKKLDECMLSQLSWKQTQELGEYIALVSGVKFIIKSIGFLAKKAGLDIVVGPYLTAAGIGVAIVEILVQFNVDLMPSKLVAINFNVTPNNVDLDGIGTWENIKLKAESEQFKFTLDHVLEIILNALGLSNSKGTIVDNAEAINDLKESISTLLKVWFKYDVKKGSLGKIGPNKYEVDLPKDNVIPEVGPYGRIKVYGNNYQGVEEGWTSLILKTIEGDFGQSPSISGSQPVQVGDDNEDREIPQPQQLATKARSTGDPHLLTFDGLKFDHHAVGEFILAKSTDGTFEVQVRESPSSGSKRVSQNSAVAMKVGNNRVSIYAEGFPDNDTSNPLRVNGETTVIQGGSLSLPGGGTIYQNGDSNFLIQWPTGEQVAVSEGKFQSVALLDIKPAIPDSRQGQMMGLMGNFNGNPDDDFMTRDGQVIPPQESIISSNPITQNLASFVPLPLNQIESQFLKQLHKQFGDSWRISQSESLFDYEPGKDTNSFTNPAFPDGFVLLRMLLPQQVQEADRICRAAGIEADMLEDCIFDVGATGNVDFAQAAINALQNEVQNRIEQEIRNNIPIPGGLNIPFP